MIRMLQYSLNHGQPIRVIFQTPDGKLVQRRATVIHQEGDRVTISSLRPREEVTLDLSQLLGADYIKGDTGQPKEEQP